MPIWNQGMSRSTKFSAHIKSRFIDELKLLFEAIKFVLVFQFVFNEFWEYFSNNFEIDSIVVMKKFKLKYVSFTNNHNFETKNIAEVFATGFKWKSSAAY